MIFIASWIGYFLKSYVKMTEMSIIFLNLYMHLCRKLFRSYVKPESHVGIPNLMNLNLLAIEAGGTRIKTSLQLLNLLLKYSYVF